MKKIIFFVLTLITMYFSTAIIYADSLTSSVSEENVQKSVIFEVTGGIESFDKKESTFDETRVVSGVAEDGTDIEISVFTKDLKGNLNEKEVYSINVGESGIFSQTVNLYVGENILEFKAAKEGLEEVELQAEIKRKKREIKTELENGISLPGGSFFRKSYITINLK